jgi:CheY-like chemotaxis protein
MEDLKKYTLLIVDDEETLRNAMIFDFKRKGFNVLSAESGAQAFEIVKKNKIHLVVSDMRMPGGDGMSLLENIRAYDPTIPTVIFVTGFADVTEEQAIAKGAKKILSKPFERKVLMDSVLDALGIA